jgi:uncharacterized protein YrrD
MQLKQDAQVLTADGQNVGHLNRVVIDPRTKEVTHVVVRKGILFTQDKVVPINLIATGVGDRVTLREDAGDLQALPDFEEVHFTVVNEEELARWPQGGVDATSLYWYPTIGGLREAYLAPSGPPYMAEKKENVPPGTVALKEGAKVITADDKHVGNVEQILTDPQADRVTHFLVSQGLLLKEKKLVPMTWVSEVNEKEVRLAVGARTLAELRAYHSP